MFYLVSVELLPTAVSPVGGAAAPAVAACCVALSAASLTSAGSCTVNNASLNQHREKYDDQQPCR